MVALAAPGVLQVTQTISKDPPLSEVLTLLAPQVDVILVEGYKSSFLPKVAVLGPESVEVPDFPKIIALVASQPPVTSLPVFHPQAVEALGKFLRQFLGFP
jgi:molybdopterin-guanine dinucleotide biosynthesis protein MobB